MKLSQILGCSSGETLGSSDPGAPVVSCNLWLRELGSWEEAGNGLWS